MVRSHIMVSGTYQRASEVGWGAILLLVGLTRRIDILSIEATEEFLDRRLLPN